LTTPVGDKLEVSKLPKRTCPFDAPPAAAASAGPRKGGGGGLFTPVLEIDLVSEPEPSGGTTETDAAEELK